MEQEKSGSVILSAACFNLGMLGTRVTQTFSERVKEVGLTHKQVGLLAVVDVEPGISQRKIAARLGVAPSLVVTLVDQLVELGAVQRFQHERDRRAYVIEMTAAGKRFLDCAVELVQQLDDEILAGCSPAGRAALEVVLDETVRGAEVWR